MVSSSIAPKGAPGAARTMLGACLASGAVHATALAALGLGGGFLLAPVQAAPGPTRYEHTVNKDRTAVVTVQLSASAFAAPLPHSEPVVAGRPPGPASARHRMRQSPRARTVVPASDDRIAAPEMPPPSPEDRAPSTGGVRSGGARLASDVKSMAVRPVLSAAAAKALRIHDVYPVPPEPLRPPGVAHVVVADICVSARGLVSDVSVASGGAAALEGALRTAIRTWRYRPLLLEGTPTPFCHAMRFIYTDD
jgi:hypothetical protein